MYDRARELAPWLDKTLVLGIRPEQITEAGGGQMSEQVHSAECQVEIVEPTGPDTLLFIRVNDTKVVCRVHPTAACQPGKNMRLAFDSSKAVFFDPKSEGRIA